MAIVTDVALVLPPKARQVYADRLAHQRQRPKNCERAVVDGTSTLPGRASLLRFGAACV